MMVVVTMVLVRVVVVIVVAIVAAVLLRTVWLRIGVLMLLTMGQGRNHYRDGSCCLYLTRLWRQCKRDRQLVQSRVAVIVVAGVPRQP